MRTQHATLHAHTSLCGVARQTQMPKTSQTRSSGIKGNISEQATISLGTLAANTGILDTVNVPVTRGGRQLSVSILGGLAGHTEGEGPLIWGVQNANLSLVELEEYLELDGPITPNDLIGQERVSRGKYIRRLGALGPGVAQTQIQLFNHPMAGLRFSETGETTGGWEFWVYNLGSQLTTGSIFRVFASWFLEWNPSG